MTDTTPDVPTGPVLTGMDLIAAALDAAVPTPTVIIAVKHRPGWAVRYRIDISQAELADWRKAATVAGDIDGPLLNRLILAHTCTGFLRQVDGTWTDVDTGSGPVTFGAIAKRDGGLVSDAVLTWLLTDGQVGSTSDRVYLEAGFAGLPETIADPTRG